MEALSVRELFNQLCAQRRIRLQMCSGEITSLHSRLCRIRAEEDKLLGAIVEENPFLSAKDMIVCKVRSVQHLEDGTELSIVEFSLEERQIRRYTVLPIDEEESGSG